jgi:hypothetical protein
MNGAWIAVALLSAFALIEWKRTSSSSAPTTVVAQPISTSPAPGLPSPPATDDPDQFSSNPDDAEGTGGGGVSSDPYAGANLNDDGDLLLENQADPYLYPDAF